MPLPRTSDYLWKPALGHFPPVTACPPPQRAWGRDRDFAFTLPLKSPSTWCAVMLPGLDYELKGVWPLSPLCGSLELRLDLRQCKSLT